MKNRKLDGENVFCVVVIGFIALLCVAPIIIALSVSLSNETDIVKNGYCIFPREFSLDTYKFLLSERGSMLFRSYGITLLTVAFGTVYTMFITTCYAYAVAQKKDVFPLGNALSFFAWFTTVFGGGVLPWYILCTKYYGLHNNLVALFIPYGMNVFNMFILRNNFKAIPAEIFESAKIDGAGNGQIFVHIAIPLAKVGLVTVGLFTILMYWNDFHLPLYLVTSSKLSTIQKFLYNMMSNVTALLSGAARNAASEHMAVPANTARMGVTILTVLPIAIVFPFTQKYFVKGITIGAVKG